MSGFLFFRDLNDKWEWGTYKRKLKSRTFTLVIPYILWNVIAYLADLSWFGLKGIITNDYGQAVDYLSTFSSKVFWSIKPIGLQLENWFGIPTPTAGPMDLPLWYLRDLIVLVLLSPALWYLFKHTKGWILGVFALGYISRVWINIPGFGITGLFFYATGAFLAMRQIDLLQKCKSLKWLWLPTLVLAAVTVYCRGTYTITGQNIMPFFIIGAVITSFNISHYFVSKGMNTNAFLVKSCFFVFACHEVVVKDVVKAVVGKVIGSPAVWPIQFVLILVLIVSICLALYYVISRFMPTLSKVLAGNK